MTGDEVRGFLEEGKVMTCATMGPNGRPHLMPLWYTLGGEPETLQLLGWTYAASQKTKNLERDPRATLQVEDGVRYDELRGVMLECDVEMEHETERVTGYGLELFRKYAGGGAELPPEVRAMVEKQAPKRVGLRFRATRVVSWDHTKLGSTY